MALFLLGESLIGWGFENLQKENLMSYTRKTEDIWNVEGDYGMGFEIVTAEDKLSRARERLREYRENEPGIAFRIRRTREPKCD